MSETLTIPPSFFGSNGENPFTHCISCERDLLKGDIDYMIEKAIRSFPDVEAREVIFEYAICLDCALKARQKLSKPSKKNIDDFLQSEAVREHSMAAMAHGLSRSGDATALCMITGEPIDRLEEYQIYAHCRGNKLMANSQAFMVSGKALEIISELLSQETRDELDRFRDTHFGLPPELEDLINSRNMILF